MANANFQAVPSPQNQIYIFFQEKKTAQQRERKKKVDGTMRLSLVGSRSFSPTPTVLPLTSCGQDSVHSQSRPPCEKYIFRF